SHLAHRARRSDRAVAATAQTLALPPLAREGARSSRRDDDVGDGPQTWLTHALDPEAFALEKAEQVRGVEAQLEPPIPSHRPERLAVEAHAPGVGEVIDRLAGEHQLAARSQQRADVAQQQHVVGAVVKALEEDRSVEALGRLLWPEGQHVGLDQ